MPARSRRTWSKLWRKGRDRRLAVLPAASGRAPVAPDQDQPADHGEDHHGHGQPILVDDERQGDRRDPEYDSEHREHALAPALADLEHEPSDQAEPQDRAQPLQTEQRPDHDQGESEQQSEGARHGGRLTRAPWTGRGRPASDEQVGEAGDDDPEGEVEGGQPEGDAEQRVARLRVLGELELDDHDLGQRTDDRGGQAAGDRRPAVGQPAGDEQGEHHDQRRRGPLGLVVNERGGGVDREHRGDRAGPRAHVDSHSGRGEPQPQLTHRRGRDADQDRKPQGAVPDERHRVVEVAGGARVDVGRVADQATGGADREQDAELSGGQSHGRSAP